jgi:hypothetical protein
MPRLDDRKRKGLSAMRRLPDQVASVKGLEKQHDGCAPQALKHGGQAPRSLRTVTPTAGFQLPVSREVLLERLRVVESLAGLAPRLQCGRQELGARPVLLDQPPDLLVRLVGLLSRFLTRWAQSAESKRATVGGRNHGKRLARGGAGC